LFISFSPSGGAAIFPGWPLDNDGHLIAEAQYDYYIELRLCLNMIYME